MRNEAELRLAIRDLYRGDGGTLNDYNQGWNDGTDAAAEIFSGEIDALLHDVERLVQRNNDLLAEVDALRDAGVGE